MKIELKNHELVPAINFLSGMVVKANEGRPVTKFKKLVATAVEELHESQMELIHQFGRKDEYEQLIPAEDGNGYMLEPSTSAEYARELNKLYDEEVIIDTGIHEKIIGKLLGILDSYEVEISGEDAEIYDRLLEEFEKEDNHA